MTQILHVLSHVEAKNVELNKGGYRVVMLVVRNFKRKGRWMNFG